MIHLSLRLLKIASESVWVHIDVNMCILSQHTITFIKSQHLMDLCPYVCAHETHCGNSLQQTGNCELMHLHRYLVLSDREYEIYLKTSILIRLLLIHIALHQVFVIIIFPLFIALLRRYSVMYHMLSILWAFFGPDNMTGRGLHKPEGGTGMDVASLN